MTKCAIILPQLLFLLEYAIRGLSNKCIYRLYLKTSKPRCARGDEPPQAHARQLPLRGEL